MKLYNLPENIKAFIFDIDSTLYTNTQYAFEQVDCQVRQYAKDLGITTNEIIEMIKASEK